MQMGDPSGDWTSNNLDHNYSRKCLPPRSANLTYPEETTTGNYFQQYSCRILQPTSYKIVTGSTPLSNDLKPAQENHLNSKCALPTGKQKNKIVLWTPPGSRVQVFVPVNNMQETNHVPNILHCVSRPGVEVFNSNNSVCMQQQSTSVTADPNSLQQFPTKTIDNKSLNDMQRDLTHANATNNLPQQDPSTKRLTLPSDYRYNNPTTTPNGQISSLGVPVYHGVRAEYSSDNAHLQTPSTCKQNVQQNNATKKAVAVVTPLSPVEMASVNFSNKSAHALDARSVPIHHLPNFTHPLKLSADPRTMREPNEPASKQQRPKSAEPRLGSDVVKSPVCLLESTSQHNHASSLKLNCPVTDQNKPSEIQKEVSEKMPKDKQAVTDKKTNTGEMDKYSTIPVIEWPLDKLHTLMNIIQQIEDVHQKNVNKMDSRKEILRLYWNGDVCKFRNAVKSGIYQNVMEDVYNYCQGKDSVILGQIKNDTWNQVAKEFHVLKHDEVPPKIEYKSSWLNLDENLDDIDRECGISWYFRHLHSSSQEQEKGNSAGKLQHGLLDAPDKPSKRQCSTETNCQNLVPEDEQTFPKSKDKTMDNEGLYEHLSVSSNEQFLPSQNTAAQTNMPNDSLISIENVSMAETSSVISAGGHCLEEDLQKVNAPQEITLSNSKPPQELNAIPRDEQISVERFEEKTNNSAHTIQNPLPDASHKSPITGHDRFATEIVSKTPAEVQTSSIHENSPVSIIEQSLADTNRHVPTLDDVVTEETSWQPNAINPLMAITNLVKTLDNQAVAKSRSSAGTSGRGRLYGGRAVQSNELIRMSNCAGSPNVKANESQVKNSTHATQSAFREGTGHRDAKAVNKVRVEKRMQLEFENKNSDCQSHLLTETGDREDNRLLKPESVVTGQTNCQPNTVNSLEGLANVFRTLEKSDISLRIYENQIGKQEVLKRSGSGGTSPILTDLLMNRSSPKLSPTVAEQRAQIQNGSDEKPTNSDCVDEMIDEPSITERDYFAMEIGNKVPAEPQIPPENVKLCKNLPGFVHEQSLTETNSNHSMKRKRVDTEHSSHQPHIVNPLAAMTRIVCSIDKRVALGKPGCFMPHPNFYRKKTSWKVLKTNQRIPLMRHKTHL
ncbi:uncharacterized protein si:ch211-106e7.2 isoform X2 [Triplophysa rosa]|uniref:uncharacterized protein si:ch211-106e7.2 isoform X2 n=1 Tax=Triplophysa rosa TaxID=992332 RepID=UPI002545D5A4|nr:uncharacterized protein si:ch211-106e7.2 isoform X2 [Triplophysa rosa]